MEWLSGEPRSELLYIDSFEPQDLGELEKIQNELVDAYTGADLVENRFILVVEIRKRCTHETRKKE